MLTTVKGNIKGNIVGIDDKEIVTAQKKPIVDFDEFVIPSGRSVEEIDNYMKEMREDRIIPNP